jgi:N-acetylmuramic acid 6-phosphate etherase
MNISASFQTTYILGIDGGGTKTVAWLAARENDSPQCVPLIVGKGSAGPSNQRAVGPLAATHNLDAAINSAFLDAGLPRATVAAACMGLAGADRNSDRGVILEWSQFSRLADKVEVVNDAVPLLHVNGGDGCGVAIIAGTGSLAWGRNSHGEIARSGGWGYLFSDEGSAFSIGRSVLQAVSRAVDGRGQQTCLLADVLACLQLTSPQEVVSAVYSHEVPRAVVASVAELAFAAADKGDAVAREIVRQAAKELAAMAVVTARRLELHTSLSLAMTGSVLIQNPPLRQEVTGEIEAAGLQISQTTVVADAVAGAVNMANRLAESVNK